MPDLEALKAEWLAAEQAAWAAHKELQRLRDVAEKAKEKYRAEWIKESEMSEQRK